MKKHELISYSMDFCSFLLRSQIGADIKRIILFGSVARGDFDNESDIDLFIDTDEKKKVELAAKIILKSFEMSDTNEKWRLKGLKNTLSIQIGQIEKWDLYRSAISSGILLYGRFEEMPKNIKYYTMIVLDFSKIERNRKISIWRELYGYRQKVGANIFTSKGLLEGLEGKKIERSVIAVPASNKSKILDFINKNKIKYKIFELWTDSF